MIHFAQILLIKQVLTILIYARSEGSTLPILEYFPLGRGDHTKDQTNGVGKLMWKTTAWMYKSDQNFQ